MGTEERVRKATCRVDHEDGQGSAFWVDDDRLITAAHVIDEAPSNTVSIRSVNGETFEATAITYDLNTKDDPGSDLALLRTSETPERSQVLPVDSDVPEIGTDVLWSGYARLPGERKLDRQRFGWGKIASGTYGDAKTFFEVDGLFNPSHSGGPVVEQSSGTVVGVVSQSAGDFASLEEEWTEKVEQIITLSKIYDRDMQKSPGTVVRTFDDPGNGFRFHRTLVELGLKEPIIKAEGETVTVIYSPGEVLNVIPGIQAEVSDLLLDTAKRTFQMGVGIASGGDELRDLLRAA